MKIGERIEASEITGALGKGGMGEVFRARDTKLGREVAVKTLPASMAHEGTLRPGTPRKLFDTAGANQFDVNAKGDRFLVVERAERTGELPFVVVQNWPALLKK